MAGLSQLVLLEVRLAMDKAVYGVFPPSNHVYQLKEWLAEQSDLQPRTMVGFRRDVQ